MTAELLSGDAPACPECLRHFNDAWEWADSGARECGFCGFRFRWRRELSVTYHTRPADDAVLAICNERERK